MTSTNKHASIGLHNTNQTKRPRQTALTPPPDLLLAQTCSAISAATTLLATLANLATTFALAASPATLPATQATQATNPAMIQAKPALPASLITMMLEPVVGVFAGLVIAPVILPATLLDPLTSPMKKKPATRTI
jgi:hypothetical protein